MLRIVVKRSFGALTFLIGVLVTLWFAYNQIWPTAEFKTHFHSIVQLVVPVLFITFGWKWMRYDGLGIEEAIPPNLKCPELDESVAQARRTMPAFIAEVEKGADGAFIKFPLQTPKGFTEHIWAYVHFHKDRRFNVSLANTPFDETATAEGRSDVSVDDVEDWQIMRPGGSITGGHSLIALFKYWERQGNALSPKMKKQKAQLLNAGE